MRMPAACAKHACIAEHDALCYTSESASLQAPVRSVLQPSADNPAAACAKPPVNPSTITPPLS